MGPLLNILETCRKDGSATEKKFAEAIKASCEKNADAKNMEVWQDGGGNILVSTDSQATTMFTCHTDTCHWNDTGPRHELRFYEEDGDIFVGTKNGSCLGADDGTGAWLMLGMIGAGVPGLYIFHRAEEVGCVGSRWIAKNTPEVLEGIERAIAFDRKGYDDVVDQQTGRRCASEKFGEALGKALGFDPDKCNPVGSITDTAQYMNVIPECTNISVGYFYQHGPREIQNLTFAVALREKLINTDFELLTPHRDPTAKERSPMPVKVQNTAPQGDLFAKIKPPTMLDIITLVSQQPELVAKYLYFIGCGKVRMESSSGRFPKSYDKQYRAAYNKYLGRVLDGSTTH